jgi:hypothetical protein
MSAASGTAPEAPRPIISERVRNAFERLPARIELIDTD